MKHGLLNSVKALPILRDGSRRHILEPRGFAWDSLGIGSLLVAISECAPQLQQLDLSCPLPYLSMNIIGIRRLAEFYAGSCPVYSTLRWTASFLYRIAKCRRTIASCRSGGYYERPSTYKASLSPFRFQTTIGQSYCSPQDFPI